MHYITLKANITGLVGFFIVDNQLIIDVYTQRYN